MCFLLCFVFSFDFLFLFLYHFLQITTYFEFEALNVFLKSMNRGQSQPMCVCVFFVQVLTHNSSPAINRADDNLYKYTLYIFDQTQYHQNPSGSVRVATLYCVRVFQWTCQLLVNVDCYTQHHFPCGNIRAEI